MKKMIAILALCAIVSLSSAAVMFQPSGAATWDATNSRWIVPANTQFTINVIADAAAGTFSMNGLVLTGTGLASWNGNTISPLFVGALPNSGVAALANANGIILTGINGATSTGTADDLSVGTAMFSITVTSGSVIDSKITVDDFTGAKPVGFPNPPTYATKLNAVTTVVPGLDITVVPEPMTMALLGLGGLFIRRRRA